MELSFEEAFKRLEEVVGLLEKGNLSLEESLALFQEGMELLKRCEALLGAAEAKIEMLLHKDGKSRRVPFPDAEDEEDAALS